MTVQFFFFLFACGHEHPETTLPKGDPVLGEELYELSCSGCHGLDGAGGYGGPNLLDQTDDHIADFIQNGEGNMPAFPDFTNQDIADVIAHIRTLEGSEDLDNAGD